jgi:DNA-binding LacI/PurR family transcriptional regulator
MPKRATAQDVADKAGVSRTTVSFVLNNVSGMRISEDTRQAVLTAAQELNYHPDATARRMVSGQTSVIGFVMRQSAEQAFADLFLPQVLNGLNQAASEEGFHILLQPISPDDNSGAYIRLLRERHVDGIVLSGPRSDDEELLKIHAEGAHIVLLGRLPGSGIPSVDVDNIGGARMAAGHLANLKHRRIAMITNAPPEYTASTARLTGYRQALEEAGLPFDPTLVRYGNFTPQSGYQAMSELLLGPRPTAVFVASDTVALGAMQAIRNHSLRIPEDISVIGFDDISAAEFLDPPLATVRLPAYGLGWGAANMLIRLITHQEIKEPRLFLETELIIRESCGQLN